MKYLTSSKTHNIQKIHDIKKIHDIQKIHDIKGIQSAIILVFDNKTNEYSNSQIQKIQYRQKIKIFRKFMILRIFMIFRKLKILKLFYLIWVYMHYTHWIQSLEYISMRNKEIEMLNLCVNLWYSDNSWYSKFYNSCLW